ncbi:MAG: family 10 glycosylhydrolase [Bacteroidota bacterium]|nr:family 10 glycosylhydrolase [Bacteroidota bacterium]
MDPAGEIVSRCAARVLTAIVAILCAAAPAAGYAQPRPPREYRAVWLTTLRNHDWPDPSSEGDPIAQRRALGRILDTLKALHFNTVFLQVRSQGNAFYRSDVEPWAAELTGRLGGDPGWDPLAWAVEQAHERGLEVHAWVNVFKAWNGESPPPATVPAHPVRAHPHWVKRYMGQYWFDPGIPAVRDYHARLLVDLASRYDIDAIHLDYVRYPGPDFDDTDTWRKYGHGAERAVWRRKNIDSFVGELASRLRAVKPTLRIGAAPIGIYRNIPRARGQQGYVELAQDARAWLKNGWVDYLAPQIYWGLTEHGSRIDFRALVTDWVEESAGKHIVIGIAAYKEEVRPQIGQMIDVCRGLNAHGEAYFRYRFIEDGLAFTGRYEAQAIPPASMWLDPVPPNPPSGFETRPDEEGVILSWRPPERALDGETVRRFVVYRRLRGQDGRFGLPVVAAVLPGHALSWRDNTPVGAALYEITALDRCNNESAPAVVAPAGQPPAISVFTPTLSDPVMYDEELALVGYAIPARMNVRIRLLEESGAECAVLVDGEQEAGTYIVGIRRKEIPCPTARVMLEAGDRRTIRPMPR